MLGKKAKLSVINVVEKNISMGWRNGKEMKGVSGYSVITYATRDKVTKIRVNNVKWYEGAMGQTPAQPYEHPIKPSSPFQSNKYKLKYNSTGSYRIKVDKASENGDLEPWTYAHMGRNSEGCIVLGSSAQGPYRRFIKNSAQY